MNILDVLFQQSRLRRFVYRLERFFLKFPHLPHPLMEFLVSLLPAIFFALGILHAVIGGIVIISSAQYITQIQGISVSISPFYLLLNGMLAVANGIFMLLAFNDIRMQTHTGWYTLTVINGVSIVQSLLSIVFSPQTSVSVLVYIVTALYLNFEFKPYFGRQS